MRNRIAARLAAACAAASAVAMVAGTAITAQAAVPGWRQVLSKQFGPAKDYSEYNVVVTTGTRDAWVLGGADESGGTGTLSKPVAAHWNGTRWGGYVMPAGVTSFIIAASAPSASDVWAVTFFGGWVLHWNGSKWLVAKHLTGGGELTGVVALSPANVWVFGGPGETGGLGTWHYNGRTWQRWNAGNAVGLENASALSGSDIWAIGGTSSPYSAIMRFNGAHWQKITASAFTGLQFRQIHAFGSSNVWVTATSQGNGMQSWLLHYNGAGWSRTKLPWAMSLGALAGDGHGGLWTTGVNVSGPQPLYSAYVVHRTATGALSRIKTASSLSSGATLSDIALISGTSLWGAGSTQFTTIGGKAVIWAYGLV